MDAHSRAFDEVDFVRGEEEEAVGCGACDFDEVGHLVFRNDDRAFLAFFCRDVDVSEVFVFFFEKEHSALGGADEDEVSDYGNELLDSASPSVHCDYISHRNVVFYGRFVESFFCFEVSSVCSTHRVPVELFRDGHTFSALAPT